MKTSKNPHSSRITAFLNYRVRVSLYDGREILGTLTAFDRHMNLVLADAEEFRTIKRRTEEGPREVKRSLGLLVLRGEAVVHVFPEVPPAKEKTQTLAMTGSLAMGTASIVRAPDSSRV